MAVFFSSTFDVHAAIANAPVITIDVPAPGPIATAAADMAAEMAAEDAAAEDNSSTDGGDKPASDESKGN